MQEEVWPSDGSESESENVSVTESHNCTSSNSALLYICSFVAVHFQNIKCSSNYPVAVYEILQALGLAFHNNDLLNATDSIPVGLQTVYNHLGISGNDFVPYVVCPSCHSVYRFEDCIVRLPFGKSESKQCCHVAYPKHPQLSRRTPCVKKMLKIVKNKSGTSLKPFKIFPYWSLKKYIQNLVMRHGFLEACEQWRSRLSVVPPTYPGDVFDGRVGEIFNPQK